MYKVLTEEALTRKIVYQYDEDSFFTTLRQRVNEYFKKTGLNKQDDPGMYLKTTIQLSMWAGFYACMLSNYFHGWLLFMFQIAFHFTMFLMSVGIAHDGSHGAYSKRPWLNKLMYRVFDLIGINSHMWEYNHNLSHHYVPNIPIYDSAIDSFGLFRLHPRAKYFNFHKFQHIYMFFLYSLSTLFKIFFLDFFSIARKRIGNVAVSKHSVMDILYLVFTKLFVVSYTLIIPVIVIDAPAWQIIGGFLAGNIIMGITLGIVFMTTHLTDNTVYAEPDEKGIIYNSFPRHVIAATADFAPNNKFVTWISGGLNLHVAHHLFPKISQVHLPAVTKILKQTCQEFAVPYKVYPTVFSALRSHLRLLKKLGGKKEYDPSEWPINKFSPVY
jgi:linoleoyl-CoA desaturase